MWNLLTIGDFEDWEPHCEKCAEAIAMGDSVEREDGYYCRACDSDQREAEREDVTVVEPVASPVASLRGVSL